MTKGSLIKHVMAGAMLLGSTGATLAADSGPSAQLLSDTCAGCHGTDGISGGPATPSIAGLSKDYFVEVMQGYRSGEVSSTVMDRIARGYGDKEFEKMAEYFSKLPFARADQPYDAVLAKTGAELHDEYCEKCHSDGGAAAEEDAGILVGQWKPYLEWTMADQIAGDRAAGIQMMKKVKKLLEKEGDEGVKALIEFYASRQ